MTLIRSKKGGVTLIELLIVLVIIGIFAMLVPGGSGVFSISEGDRIGVIPKFSYGGIMWDTWEGQMILGGQGTVTTNVWPFSVDEGDTEVISGIKTAMDKRELVKLSYRKNFFSRPWRGSTTYFVYKVTPVWK